MHFNFCIEHDLMHISIGFLQFSVTEHFRNAELGHFQSLPGVFFFYDLSPIKVSLPIMERDGKDLSGSQI